MNVELNFEKRYRLVREVIETIVLTLLMFLVINLAVQNFDVDGHSMEPNLHDQERLMVDKWTYMFHPPARGDVVVFVAPPQPTLDYVKRIIAIPGDTLTIRNTTVIVDGVTLNETYINPANQGNPFAEKRIENMVIPPGDYFVLGDNRANSSDSRDWGLLPRNNIIGRAALVYWPLRQDNDGLLPNVSQVFANVHQQNSGAVLQHSPPASLPYADSAVFGMLPVLVIGVRTRRRRKTY
ncbi:MAG: signal peptidase I [Chloroflexota bacterium]|nr:signal peptidase I [Chloroflexota bacterium]